jgi:hypothetical protein
MILGMAVLRNVAIACMSGIWLMIPWVALRTRSVPHLAYVLFVNVVFMIAMIPDIRGMIDRQRRGVSGDYDAAMEATPMGGGIKKIANRLGMTRDQ